MDVVPHGKFMPKNGEKEFEELNAEEKEIASIPFSQQKIGIIETTPFDFKLNTSRIKIANTMVESDVVGKPWVKQCNAMDFIVVPNEFQKRAFESSGVKSPVVVVPHGTETEKFPYMERPILDDVFTFGIVGWLDDRKGVFDVIRAFASEFTKGEGVRLILKSSNPDFGYYSQFNDKRIKTINTLMSAEDLKWLYYEMDCFVFPSKAEGIGQPPREAMSTGLPVIVGNYSGLEEIAHPSISYPIQPSGFTTRDEWAEQPGRWANYDIQELMYQMRYVYEHREEAREVGRRASKYINERASWSIAAKKMIQFLETID